MAISVQNSHPTIRLLDSAADPVQRNRMQTPAVKKPPGALRHSRSAPSITQAQLLAALLTQIAAAGEDPRDHPAFAILEATARGNAAGGQRSPLHWHDAPEELLATAQDGGRQMMTRLLALYMR